LKDAFYFSHDSNARSDLKIQALRSKYGTAGYGMYWIIIEMMRESADHKLPFNQKFAYYGFSNEFGCTAEEAKNFINDCIYEFALFVCDEHFFWSDSLNRRMEKYKQKVNVKSENGLKGGRPKKQAEQPQEAAEVIETEQDKPKREKPVRAKNATVAQYSDDVIFLTDLLIQKMKVNNPNVNDPNLNNWRENIRLMMDNDGYTFDQVKRMIEFSQTDDFWKSNILSTKKLRDKAGTLVIQMNREVSSAKGWSDNRKPIVTPSRFAGINDSCTLICDDEPEPERIEQIRAKAAEYDGVRLRTV
jgi:hypothetical protein